MKLIQKKMREKKITTKWNSQKGTDGYSITTALKGLRPYLPQFAVSMLFSVTLYFMLLSRQLVNSNDGLWEYSYYKAGKWSLSLGRWFWLYLDRLRFGFSPDPLTSLITLSCYCAGLLLMLDLFEIGKRKVGYFACMLFLGSVSVCSSLAYRFMSPTFGTAFLLSMAAAWVIAKWKAPLLSPAAGSLLLALSLGLYQSYIGCACIALSGYFLYSVSRQQTTGKEILAAMARALAAGVLGGILYAIILNLHLSVFHIRLSDYNGASAYSLKNTILHLPDSITRVYREFFRYFSEKSFLLTPVRELPLSYGVLAPAAVCLLWLPVKCFKSDKIKALLGLFLILLSPLACNIVVLAATAAEMSVLMTSAMALCLPVFLCLLSRIEYPRGFFPWIRRLGFLAAALVLYGSIYQLQIDQHALMEGQAATVTMAEEILHRLDEEDCLDSGLEYCVVGVPSHNDLFEISRIYENSNMYARFGSWYRDPSCSRRSWQGVFSHLCGINLTMCPSGEYGALCSDEEVKNMPLYPESGFIARRGNIVVVKISDD